MKSWGDYSVGEVWHLNTENNQIWGLFCDYSCSPVSASQHCKFPVKKRYENLGERGEEEVYLFLVLLGRTILATESLLLVSPVPSCPYLFQPKDQRTLPWQLGCDYDDDNDDDDDGGDHLGETDSMPRPTADVNHRALRLVLSPGTELESEASTCLS